MPARLLDYNPLTGESQWFHWNADGTFTIEYKQDDISQNLEANKRQVIEADHKKQIQQDWIRYASIPNIIAMKWKNELGVDVFNKDHSKAVFRLLNSPDYRFLKTTAIHHEPKR